MVWFWTNYELKPKTIKVWCGENWKRPNGKWGSFKSKYWDNEVNVIGSVHAIAIKRDLAVNFVISREHETNYMYFYYKIWG